MDGVGLGALAAAFAGVVVAVVSATAALRSARASEKSAEVARDALRDARESRERHARAAVAGLVPQIRAARKRAEELAESLVQEYRLLVPSGVTSLMKSKVEEFEAVPDELRPYYERAEIEDLGMDALRRLSPEELEDVAADLRSSLAHLQHRSEAMADELRHRLTLNSDQRFVEALRRLAPAS